MDESVAAFFLVLGFALVVGLTSFLILHFSKKQGGSAPYLAVQLLKTSKQINTEIVVKNIVFNLDTGTDLKASNIVAAYGQIASPTINIDTQGQVANSINGMSYSVNVDCILTIFARPKTKKTKYAVIELYANKSSTSKSDIKYHSD